MNVGIIGACNIGANAARLFARPAIGSLREGGCKQQPGSAIYNNPMADEQARETLAGMN